MDKNAIKKYAIWARNELIARVTQKAQKYGFTKEEIVPGNADSVNGVLLSDTEKKQRQAMIKEIHEKGLEQVIEEISYTWFNRFAALRFMEVNGYLPSHVRVFTDADNHFKPQILTEAIHLELEGLDRDRVYALKQDNKTEELFRYLLIAQCNALSKILPGMFQKISDYTELMLPDNLLREGSVIEQMVTMIPEEDWTDQVQIIGWLYQYYNTEPKDQVFADLKKNIKISKEKIPAATQLFTPDWIVHYMVENSLGRLWLEGHPDSADSLLPTKEEQAAYAAGERNPADTKWHYYLEEAEQEPEVEAQLAKIRKEYTALKPEEILCIDPCMGSGHILCVLFDTLVQIYEAYGYTAREAAGSIIENNLWGLDIDERAAQLAYFAVMMKARQYDHRFLSRKKENGEPDIPQPHVLAIAESNRVDADALKYFCQGDVALTAAMQTIKNELHDAKEYGSILTTTKQDWPALYARFDEIRDDISIHKNAALALEPLVKTAQALGQKYNVTITNPPYMGDMNKKLQTFVKTAYPDSKHDLCSVFIEKNLDMTEESSFCAMITQNAFMFLSRYEKLRRRLLNFNFINMAHLGSRAFDSIGGEVVQTSAFCIRKQRTKNYICTYERLTSFPSEVDKEKNYLEHTNTYYCKNKTYEIIPKAPMTYWISQNILNMFKLGRLDEFSDPRVGMFTTDNNKYLKEWWEVDLRNIGFNFKDKGTAYASDKKWFPYNKGGGYRRWYGNIDLVVYWKNGGEEIKKVVLEKYPYLNGNYDFVLKTNNPYFQPGITWSGLTTGSNSFRLCGEGFLFDTNKGAMIFEKNVSLYYILGFLNTKVAQTAINILNSTISLQIGDVASIPFTVDSNNYTCVKELSSKSVEDAKKDWDSFEVSWDFRRHPMVLSLADKREQMESQFRETRMQGFSRISFHYERWNQECDSRFQTMKSNEEELNRIFIDIYGLRDELTPDVADKDVTVRRFFDTKDDIPESMRGSSYALTKQDAVKSLISYAVGCMFGRYSLYKEGLIFAGEEYSLQKYVDKLNDRPNLISEEEMRRALLNEGLIIDNNMFIPDEDNIIPICDDEYFTDDIVGLFVKFIETVYGAETLEENLRFIADALGGRGTSREVIRNYFLNDFYKDHLKTYQKRPIYWLFDSGKKNGFKCLIYMHRYQPDTIARIRTDYVHEQQSRYRTAIADLEQRVSGASTSERVKLNRQLQKLRAQDTELRLYEEKIHHLADQYIPIDLDDGVKVNYAKFQDVLAKIQ